MTEFQPLTEDQFNAAKSKGFSIDQIIAFEQKRKSLTGGAESPANLQAKQEQKKAESNVGLFPDIGRTAKSFGETAGVMANSALFGIPGITSELLSGGKMVNPLTHGLRVTQGGTNVFEGKDLSGGQKLAAELGGAVLPVGGVLKSVFGNVFKYANPKNQVKLAEEVQNTLLSQKHNVIEKYGKEYEDIIGKSDKKVNINPAVKNFVDEAQSIMQNPEFVQQVAAKNPQANKIMDIVKKVTDAKVPDEMSAKEADKLSKFIKDLPSIKTKLAQGRKYGFHTVQWTNEDRMLIGMADDIKSAVVDAHPELSSLNKEYGQFMNSYKKVSPEFKIGSTVDKMKNYNTLDPQKKLMFESIMPKSTVDKIKDFNRADAMSKVLKTLGMTTAKGIGLGAAAGAGYEAIKHLE